MFCQKVQSSFFVNNPPKPRWAGASEWVVCLAANKYVCLSPFRSAKLFGASARLRFAACARCTPIRLTAFAQALSLIDGGCKNLQPSFLPGCNANAFHPLSFKSRNIFVPFGIGKQQFRFGRPKKRQTPRENKFCGVVSGQPRLACPGTLRVSLLPGGKRQNICSNDETLPPCSARPSAPFGSTQRTSRSIMKTPAIIIRPQCVGRGRSMQAAGPVSANNIFSSMPL